MSTLLLKKGGILELKYWDTESHSNITRDVTDQATFNLMRQCELDDDVTLRDVFLVLQRDLDVYKIIINNWVEELVEEAFQPAERESDVDYLELYWNITVDRDEKFPCAPIAFFPSFHGWGSYDDGSGKGGIGLMMSKVSTLMDYPLKLRKDVLFIDDTDMKNPITTEYQGATYSLLHILYGIIWEMSFLGGPSDRDEKIEEMEQTIERIKSGEEKTYSMDEVFERFERIKALQEEKEADSE
jgi:hypothetical protein